MVMEVKFAATPSRENLPQAQSQCWGPASLGVSQTVSHGGLAAMGPGTQPSVDSFIQHITETVKS